MSKVLKASFWSPPLSLKFCPRNEVTTTALYNSPTDYPLQDLFSLRVTGRFITWTIQTGTATTVTVHVMKAYRVSSGTASLILSFGINESVRTVQPKRCNFSQFIYFSKTLYMFQMVFPSIIRSSKLHIQRQVFVRPLLLSATSSSIGMTNTWRCMCSFELLMMDGKPVWNM